MKDVSFLKILIAGFLLAGGLPGFDKAHAAAGVTYYGRLLMASGEPVISGSVHFKIQIRTPGTENCLLYEEQQVKDLSETKGVFAVTVNDGTATVLNTEPFSLDRVFQNRGTFNFSAGKCAVGNTYSPNPADGRLIAVEFNDGSFVGWEQIPTQSLNFVPMAIESLSVGGFNSNNLFRVVDGSGSPAVVPALTQTQHGSLIALAEGTSTSYLNGTSPLNGANLTNGTVSDAKLASGISGAKISGDIPGHAAGFTGSLNGDVTGSQSATVVTKIQGRPVDTAAPTNGQALVWSAGNSRWEPGTVSGGGSADWSTLNGKPSTFPSDWTTTANKPASFPSDWSTLANIPASFTPSAHTHSITDITSGVGNYFTYRPNNGACTVGEVLKWSAANGGSWLCGTDVSATGGGGVASVSATAPLTVDNTDPNNPRVEVSNATTTSNGVVQLATSSDTTANLVVQANDPRLTNSRAPNGAAGGELSGTYPNPTVVASTTTTNNSLVRRDGSGNISGAAGIFSSLSLTNGTSSITLSTPVAFTTYATKLPASAGTNGQVLTSNGTDMIWAAPAVNVAGIASAAGTYLTYRPDNTACATGQVLKWTAANRWECADDEEGTGGGVTSVSGSGAIQVTGTTTPTVSVQDASTAQKGVVQLATGVETVAGKAVQANDARLTNSRAPTGAATGDLADNYPNPTVARIRGHVVASTTPQDGQVYRWNGTSSQWEPTNFGVDDLLTSSGLAQFPIASCTAAQTLAWASISDTFQCSDIVLSHESIGDFDDAVDARIEQKIGALEEGKWCKVTDGKIVCVDEAPGASTVNCLTGNAWIGAECAPGSTGSSGKPLYAGRHNGSKYMITPGGCTNSATPTCAGTNDTLGKAWGAISTSHTSAGDTNGQANTTGQVATYGAANAAAKYCDDMDYAGYDDWFLPAYQELITIMAGYQAIGGFASTSSTYWSSSTLDNNTAKTVGITDGILVVGSTTKNTSFGIRLRCVRKISAQLTASPASIANMNVVYPATSTSWVTVTISNTGEGTSPTLTASVSGSRFSKGTDTCTGNTLGSGATCTVAVRAAADDNGTYSGSLTVSGSGITTSVPLSGTASGIPIFAYTGSNQSWVVPAGVTSITVKAWGGGGGSGGPDDGEGSNPGDGGGGAYATSTLAVTPGETLTIVVGGRGTNGTKGDGVAGGAGGFGGGAAGGAAGSDGESGAGGGGGGASSVKRGSTNLIVAAGGGGGGGEGGNSSATAGHGGAGGVAGTAGDSATGGGTGTSGTSNGVAGQARGAYDGGGGGGGGGGLLGGGGGSRSNGSDRTAAGGGGGSSLGGTVMNGSGTAPGNSGDAARAGAGAGADFDGFMGMGTTATHGRVLISY